MTLYATVYDRTRQVWEVESDMLRRLGNSDLYTATRNGEHYGTIYHAGQLYTTEAGAWSAWNGITIPNTEWRANNG